MHLLLTDRLTCPRCGPTFGLILLADRMDERRVVAGSLGCPNCRDRFRVADGFADLRAPPRGELGDGLVGPGPGGVAEARALPGGGATAQASALSGGGVTAETSRPPGGGVTAAAERLAALLGVPRGPGTLALVGEPARHGPAIAASIEDVQVVGIDPDLRSWPDRPGFSRLVSAPGIPFFSGVLRGVAVDARLGPAWVEEAARVAASMARVVVVQAGEEMAPMLQGLGLTVLAVEAGTVVAARS